MNKQNPHCLDFDHTITRRKFLGTTALSSAALLSGGITALLRQSASASHGGFDFVEKSILELQAAMAAGQLDSRRTDARLHSSHQSLNPLIHSVIELNPNAIAIATQLDAERRRGQVRGPLHGIRFSSRTTSRLTTKCKRRQDRSRFMATTCLAML